MPTHRETQRGLELHLLLLGGLACLVVPWGAVAVRLHPRDATSLALLASEWNGFNGSETWGLRDVDCTAMEGVFCDKDGFVAAIMLKLKNFGAPIPDMISRFQRLNTLSALAASIFAMSSIPLCQALVLPLCTFFALLSWVRLELSSTAAQDMMPLLCIGVW
ncbi:hypothetical protein CLOP_g1221 [Closterium sp. NIES-67]|nr:hypothetical protein CLOP_g1221 [Closterium sp. NIES-67]